MKLFRPAFLGVALLAAFTLPVLAAEKKADVTPDADAVLKSAAQFYKSVQAARVEVRVHIVQEVPGEPKASAETKGVFELRRPNQLALRITQSPDGAGTLVSDGKTVWAHLPDLNQFITDDAPATLETLLRDNRHVAMFTGKMGPLTELFRDAPRETILNGVNSVTLAGKEKIGDVECLRLHGEQDAMDWDAWFEAGPKPTLRKFVFSPLKGMLAAAPDEVKEKLKGARIDATVFYENWNFDTAVATANFAFDPPKNAKKVAEFAANEEPAAPEPAAEKAPALQGKPAPAFALDLLDGGKLQPADYKGKGVVVLDFWATWCGPCVRALPILNEVALAFRDKGVSVFAVNLKEDAAAVRKFTEAHKLTLPVAMDAQGEVAQLYQVTGIPQTVIIDKDGNVAAIHVGFSPNLKEKLTKELEQLLAK